jgi:hypothetical protein
MGPALGSSSGTRQHQTRSRRPRWRGPCLRLRVNPCDGVTRSERFPALAKPTGTHLSLAEGAAPRGRSRAGEALDRARPEPRPERVGPAARSRRPGQVFVQAERDPDRGWRGQDAVSTTSLRAVTSQPTTSASTTSDSSSGVPSVLWPVGVADGVSIPSWWRRSSTI